MASRSIAQRLPRRLLLGAGVGALAALSSGPVAAEEPTLDAIEYRPTELPPPGARVRLILTGFALTAGWYGASVGTSYLWSDAPNAKDLRLPVVGPWMALGDAGCGDSESGCSTPIAIVRTAFAIVSGVGQIGGLFGITEGLLMDTGSSTTSARTPATISSSDATLPGVTATAVPVLLPDGALVEISGRF